MNNRVGTISQRIDSLYCVSFSKTENCSVLLREANAKVICRLFVHITTMVVSLYVLGIGVSGEKCIGKCLGASDFKRWEESKLTLVKGDIEIYCAFICICFLALLRHTSSYTVLLFVSDFLR